jgi:hypothetical protein
VLCALSLPPCTAAQEISLEYRVKAAYLFNFAKFVEWPPSAPAGPLTICVAGRDVFGDILAETIKGETLEGRSLAARVILEPEPGCHIVFVPRGSATPAYLRAARNLPALTVGEAPDFIDQGGIINFILDGANVRFEIDQAAADRVGLRIS